MSRSTDKVSKARGAVLAGLLALSMSGVPTLAVAAPSDDTTSAVEQQVASSQDAMGQGTAGQDSEGQGEEEGPAAVQGADDSVANAQGSAEEAAVVSDEASDQTAVDQSEASDQTAVDQSEASDKTAVDQSEASGQATAGQTEGDTVADVVGTEAPAIASARASEVDVRGTGQAEPVATVASAPTGPASTVGIIPSGDLTQYYPVGSVIPLEDYGDIDMWFVRYKTYFALDEDIVYTSQDNPHFTYGPDDLIEKGYVLDKQWMCAASHVGPTDEGLEVFAIGLTGFVDLDQIPAGDAITAAYLTPMSYSCRWVGDAVNGWTPYVSISVGNYSKELRLPYVLKGVDLSGEDDVHPVSRLTYPTGSAISRFHENVIWLSSEDDVTPSETTPQQTDEDAEAATTKTTTTAVDAVQARAPKHMATTAVPKHAAAIPRTGDPSGVAGLVAGIASALAGTGALLRRRDA